MTKKKFISPPVKKDEEITVEISDLAYGGDSIAKYNNFTIFIPYGVPGDRIKAKIIEVKKDFARGVISAILKKSSIHKKPECKLFGICGGCDWMNIVYTEQCRYKEKFLKHMLENIANIKNFKPDKIQTYDVPLYYRNRVQYKLIKEKNNIKLGFFKARSHNVVGVENCFILKKELNFIAEKIYNEINKFKQEVSIYDEKTGKGYLRYICLRSNRNGDILLTFVIAKKEIKPWLIKLVDILKQDNLIKGIVANFNFEKGNRVFGDNEKLLYGKLCITEKIRDIEFKIDSASFFQVNVLMLEKMVEFVEKNTSEGTNILDLYGGVGALTLPLHNKYSKIVIVEIEKNATDKLNETIKLNGLKNIKVINARAESILEKIIDEQKIDEVVLDPPRKGLHPHIINVLNKSDIKKIIYISCNPASFSRDILRLKESYMVKKIVPLDQFAQTYHLEIMAELKKKTG